jgi:hypothetical protein
MAWADPSPAPEQDARRHRSFRTAHLMAVVAAIAVGLSAWSAVERRLIPPGEVFLILRAEPPRDSFNGQAAENWAAAEVGSIRDDLRSTWVLERARTGAAAVGLTAPPTAAELARVDAAFIPKTFLVRLSIEVEDNDPMRDMRVLHAAADALIDASAAQERPGYLVFLKSTAFARGASPLRHRGGPFVVYALAVVLVVLGTAVLLARRSARRAGAREAVGCAASGD